MKSRLALSVASKADLEELYRARHEVYAEELGQYEARPDGTLPDAERLQAVYLVARVAGKLAGFVGITPPDSPCYSVDRYLRRDEIPLPVDRHLYEIRALTVLKSFRGRWLAAALMYAAFRWVESHGGTRVMAIGRREVVEMYLRVGMERVGPSFRCGAVTFDLLMAATERIGKHLAHFPSGLDRLERLVDWRLDVAFRRPPECYHGGAFFRAVGESFDRLAQKDEVISADVLDAWFPPVPAVQEVLGQHLEWIIRTSPPTRAEGLTQAIARARGVEQECVLAGGGSSDLIFLALRQWLGSSSRVLLLDPMYGEYAHVVEQLVKCRVERFTLDRSTGYRVDTGLLARKLSEGFDLFIWVNPNNPTGLHVDRREVISVLDGRPAATRVWVDETYVEYAGRDQSLEHYAVQHDGVVVCKSLSKAYALSGLRVGYLCGSAQLMEGLRPLNPPWAISLPAQIAATYALREVGYYARCHAETHRLREQLRAGLRGLGITEMVPGLANYVMFHLPEEAPEATTMVMRCREQGLFLRDLSGMGSSLGPRALRIAVKDAATNQRMLRIVEEALTAGGRA